MSFEVDLRDQIEVLTLPWKDSHSRPPFRKSELIVFALINHTQLITLKTVVKWLSENLRYYNNLVLNSFWASLNPHAGGQARNQANELMQSLVEATYQYELPVKPSISHDNDVSYSTSEGEARIYLAYLLGDGRQGAFPFLRLPADVRAIIYDMIVAFPPSGIWPLKPNIGALTRDFSVPFRMDDWYDDPENDRDHLPISLPSPSQIHSLRLVNKQISEESSYHFFSINTFYFCSLYSLEYLIREFSSPQLQAIRHIAVHYLEKDAWIANQGFEILSSLNKLQKLDIYFDENVWLHTHQVEMVDVRQIPGLALLCQMPGLREVTFHGYCPNVVDHPDAEINKPGRDHKVAFRTQPSPLRSLSMY